MTTIEITDQMVDRAERWLCGHDAWELPYGSTGSGEAARTILEAALADPPVRGSADGMVEPGPPKPLVPDMQAYESLSGLVQHLREDVTALQEQFASHQHRPPVYGRTSGPVSPPDEPITEPPDPGAGDAEKWEAVSDAHEYSRTRGGSRHTCGQIAVNEAIRQGLVWPRDYYDDADGETPNACEVCRRPVMYGSRHVHCGEYAMKMERLVHRIDPDDPEQVRVVAEACRSVGVCTTWDGWKSTMSKDEAKEMAHVVLTALKGGAR